MLQALGGLMEAQPEAEPQEGQQAPKAYSVDDVDPLIDRARGLVIAHQKASISLIQRHLQISYNRAARLLEALEVAGIVSPMQSNGSRQVLTQEAKA